MLYIIYGLTTTVGRESRRFFIDRGVNLIEKLTYEPSTARVKPSDGILHRATTEEEVRACSYVYENHGRIVGVTLDQIFAALNGRRDSLLTFSAENADLIRDIKSAYSNRVVSIYAYIEERTLRHLTDTLPHNADASEKEHRLNMGAAIRSAYLKNHTLFDETVLYCGEDSTFNMEALLYQYESILEKYKDRNEGLVDLPYGGQKPYLFVSYARKDTAQILPYLNFLRENGCRIWYDKGIEGGEVWADILSDKISTCAQYLVFSSANSVDSKWTRREISMADEYDRDILTVRMDDARFNKGTEARLSDNQNLFTASPDFEEALLKSIKAEVREE